ncbi:MAG: sigma-70 family RNA polymerase sigma factor [Proteobacteria bacterium]|nr:sigma-70 family RNA polymerase sigma factor [Pseudomonadota bacterium]
MLDTQAFQERDEIIKQYLPFAKKLAKTFYLQRKHLPIEKDDYEASAMLGLCNAASRFNADYGVEFKNYSYYRIYGEMCDSLRKGGWNLIKEYQEAEQNRISDESSDKFKVRSREQEVRNIGHFANELGFEFHSQGQSEDEYKAELSYLNDNSPEEVAVCQDRKMFVAKLVSSLPARERQVIELYYFQGLTFEDMRQHFANATKSWICKLHKKAINLLQELIVKSQLKEETRDLTRC